MSEKTTETTAEQSGDAIPSAPETSDSPQFEPALIERAQEAGLSDEEARAFGTPEHLERSLSIYDRKIAATGKKLQEEHLARQKQPAEKPKEQVAELLKKFEFKGGEDYYDDTLRGDLMSMNDHYHTEVHNMKQLLALMLGAMNQQANATSEQEFDDCVSSLGDEYTEFVGRGKTSDLDPDSEELRWRNEIRDHEKVLALGYRHAGNPVPPRKVLNRRAASIVLADKLRERAEESARQKLEQQVKKRATQVISRPTHREVGEDVPADSHERAVRAVAAKAKELGWSYD